MNRLEDELSDVIAKAQRGLGIATSSLAANAGLGPQETRALRGNDWSEEAIRAVAPHLQLDPQGLLMLARGDYQPSARKPRNLHIITTPMDDENSMQVNAYLLANRAGAVLIDTGTDPEAIFRILHNHRMPLLAILITHTHWDHVDALGVIRTRFPRVPAFAPAGEAIDLATPLRAGESHAWGGLHFRSHATAGHSPDALSYSLDDASEPLVFAGDALFAGSVGGIPQTRWQQGLRAVEEEILSLPPETLVCPGHGCLSSVAYERRHNPFFPQLR